MKHTRLLTGGILAAMTLQLAGCDSSTASRPGNTTLGSATAGALVGAGIGALANKKSPWTGAAIGAAAGTVAGTVAGNAVEQRRDAKIAQEQQQIQALDAAYNQGRIDEKAKSRK